MGSSLSWESSFRHETDDWRVENISRSVSYRQLDEVIAVAHWTRTNKLGFTTKHTGDCRLLIVNADNMIEEKNQPFEDHFIDSQLLEDDCMVVLTQSNNLALLELKPDSSV